MDDIRIYFGVLTAAELEAIRVSAVGAAVPKPGSTGMLSRGAVTLGLGRRRK